MDPQAPGHLSPAPHDTEIPKVANSADKQPPFTLQALLPWLPEKDHQHLHSKMEEMESTLSWDVKSSVSHVWAPQQRVAEFYTGSTVLLSLSLSLYHSAHSLALKRI